MDDNTMLLHLLAGLAMERESVCGDKLRHPSEEKAANHAEWLNERSGDHKVEVYPCPYCLFWHVGGEISRPRLRYLARKTLAAKEGDRSGET